jgi:hypothetical protein
MSRVCLNGSVLVDGPEGPIKEGLVVAAGCKRWDCQNCGPLKARELEARLSQALTTYHEDEVAWLCGQRLDPGVAWHIFKFLTLTVDVKRFIEPDRYARGEWPARPEEALRALSEVMRAWNRLHSWLRKLWRSSHAAGLDRRAKWEKAGRTVPFLWVLEFTRNGWPHLHVVLLWRPQIAWPDLQSIRRLWDKYRIGRNVGLENKNWKWQGPHALGRYLSKYLSKQWASWTQGHKLRRWSSSRDFLPTKQRVFPGVDGGWSQANVDSHRRERLRAGATVRNIRSGFIYQLAGDPIIPPDLFAAADPTFPRGYQFPGLSLRERLRIGHTRLERHG